MAQNLIGYRNPLETISDVDEFYEDTVYFVLKSFVLMNMKCHSPSPVG